MSLTISKNTSGGQGVGADITINSETIGRGGGNIITNVADGYQALTNNTIEYNNIALGYQALNSTTNNYCNTAVGNQSGLKTIGGYNTFVGNNAGYSNTNGGFNTLIGSITSPPLSAGLFNCTTVGANIGYNSSNTTILGYGAQVTGTQGTAIGYNSSALANQITLGTITETVNIPGAFTLTGAATFKGNVSFQAAFSITPIITVITTSTIPIISFPSSIYGSFTLTLSSNITAMTMSGGLGSSVYYIYITGNATVAYTISNSLGANIKTNWTSVTSIVANGNAIITVNYFNSLYYLNLDVYQ